MIDPTIEQTLAPSRQEWKDGVFMGKTIAFLTSAAMAWGLLIVALAVTYVLLKMPASQPAEPVTMTIEPITQPVPSRTLPAPKRQKSATQNIATQAINTPAMPSFEETKPVKKESSTDDPLAPALAEFDKQRINFESKL